MTYLSDWIKLSDAVSLVKERGELDAEEQLLSALQDDLVAARGLVDGARGEISSLWWSHKNSDIKDDIVFFDPKSTSPPTPSLVERIHLRKADIDRLWPLFPDADEATSSGRVDIDSPGSAQVGDPVAPKPATKGRPPGSGFPGDEELVSRGLLLMDQREVTSCLAAARAVAETIKPNLRDGKLNTTIERLRKKIATAWRLAKNDQGVSRQ